MKDGKSITQFTRQESLTGDELLLVNQIQNDETYVSRYMRLSALRDYIYVPTYYTITFVDNDDVLKIIENVAPGTTPSYSGEPTKSRDDTYEYSFSGWDPEPYPADRDQTYVAQWTKTVLEPEPIADDATQYVFITPNYTVVKTLSAGTWECTIVGGGGGLYSQQINNYVNKYTGHSSPLIKGTFTLAQNTVCKFHVGNSARIGSYYKKQIRPASTIGNQPEIYQITGTQPKDTDGDLYVYEGDPSYILIGDDSAELNQSNSIVAVKAQKWYTSKASKNTPYGWNYWDRQENPYINRNIFTLSSGDCKDGSNGKGAGTNVITISQGKTDGTNYGRTPGVYTYPYTYNDGVCTHTVDVAETETAGTGGYIKVKKIS